MSSTSLGIVYFLVVAFSSITGAISGIGGGVIIKPVMDSLGTMDVPAISFLSGCTVLTMSSISLLRSAKTGTKIRKKISIFLALGAALGGVTGKALFQYARTLLGSDRFVGITQAILLLAINVVVFLYMLYKARIHGKELANPFVSVMIGLLLGILSSFLGIGGGPLNIIVLYFFYSMRPKETAVNSLFIVFCSQVASLMTSLIAKTVPVFQTQVLVVMCLGGVTGSLLGGRISSKISELAVERFFGSVLILLMGINIYNIMRFSNM